MSNSKLERTYLSLIERLLEALSFRLVRFVPQGTTPNQLTIIAFVGQAGAGLSFYLATYSRFWLIVAVVGMLCHMVFDQLDGTLARQRNLASTRGQYLDIMLDCLGTIILFTGVAASGFVNLKLAFLPPLLWFLHLALEYNWVILKQKWIFPFFSNPELQLTLSALALITLAAGPIHFDILGHTPSLFDLAYLLALALSTVEWVYWAVKLYRQLDSPSAQ